MCYKPDNYKSYRHETRRRASMSVRSVGHDQDHRVRWSQSDYWGVGDPTAGSIGPPSLLSDPTET